MKNTTQMQPNNKHFLNFKSFNVSDQQNFKLAQPTTTCANLSLGKSSWTNEYFLHDNKVCHVKITSNFVILDVIDLQSNMLFSDTIPIKHFELLSVDEFIIALHRKDKLIIKRTEDTPLFSTTNSQFFGCRTMHFYNPYVEHNSKEPTLKFKCGGDGFEFVIIIGQNTNESLKSEIFCEFIKKNV